MNNLIKLENTKDIKFNDIKTYVKEFIELNTVDKNEKEYLKLIDKLKKDTRKNVIALAQTLEKHIKSYNDEVIRVEMLYNFDRGFGANIVAGVDEVGRGPLAGPIVSAAVVLDLNSDELILRINDSKKVNKAIREELSEIIKEKALSYSIAVMDNKIIDEKGIGFCNNEVFKQAISNLNVKPDLVLSDGYPIKNFDIKNEYVIKGDTKSAAIACASIIAKVYRDKLMEEYSKVYPQYGFENNVGYGSKEHIAAILKYGATDLHRKSFLSNILTSK